MSKSAVAAVPPSESKRVEIPRLRIETFEVTLVGDSPLIVHRFDEKSKRAILEKQQKLAKAPKEAKDPFRCYVDSLYWMSPRPANPTEKDVAKGKFGFPAIGFKAAAVDAANRGADMKATNARAAFHIPCELVEIIGKPQMREDVVRLMGTTADLRYRAEFPEWKAKIRVSHNASFLSAEQIINLFNIAGFSTGVGEWRPEKGGSYGRFHVEVS